MVLRNSQNQNRNSQHTSNKGRAELGKIIAKERWLGQLDFAEQNGLFDTPGRQSLERRLRKRNPSSVDIRRLDKLVSKEKSRQAIEAPFPKPSSLQEGDINIGIDPWDEQPFYISKQNLNSHILITARTRAGKTTLIINQLAPEIIEYVDSVILMDCKKSGLRRLKPVFESRGEKLCIVSGRKDLKWNPLQFESGVDAKEMVPVNAGVIGGSSNLDFPSIAVLQDLIGQLYYEHGLFDDPTSQNFPMISHLLTKLEQSFGINKLVLEALRSRLTLLGISGEIFRHKVGWKTEDLTAKNRNVLFELGGMSDHEQALFMTSFVAREFTRLRAKGVFGEPTKCFMIFDDAQQITGPKSPLAEQINISGEMGLSFCLSVQSPQEMHPAFLANCGTKFLGPTADARDAELMCKSMSMLTLDQMRWLTKLEPGIFLGKIAVNYTKPFIFLVPWIEDLAVSQEIQNFANDDDLGFLKDLSVTKADEHEETLPSSWTGNRSKKRKEPKVPNKTQENTQGQFVEITEDHKKILRLVTGKPGLTFTELTKNSGMGGSRTPEIRNQLVALGYITIQKDQGGKGASTKRLIPTKQAYEVLGLKPSKHAR